jgi:hypothetical protein
MSGSNDTGILTETQRDFLKGNGGDMTDRGERAAKTRIRERFRNSFDDLRLLFNHERRETAVGDIGLRGVLNDIEGGYMWPLAALLFIWAREHPTLPDLDDAVAALSSPEGGGSPSVQMDRTTTSFNTQVESGVHAALELEDLERVPTEVHNDLTVSLSSSVSDMSDEELAALPHETAFLLFKKGSLDNSEYARIVQLKADGDSPEGVPGRDPDDGGEEHGEPPDREE